MPVIESYPSIVGIAQVSQAAGQGRYNKWLAEYNARSNQMSTNAALSGFQAGSSLGMSVQNMWQQQQQFAQRQGFIESQAAQTLQKDTERAAAMIPALDPYVKQLYPHLNEEQRGAYIGSLDGRQLDAMTNNLGNASRARAAYDQFGSPQALRKQAKATYDKMVTGQKHQNQRVQARLEPLFQRMRDNDLGLNERSVQAEIAKILQEEGEAKEGRSFQEQVDQFSADIYNNEGTLVSKIVEVSDGKGGRKTMEIKMPQATTTGTRTRGSQAGGTMEDLAERNKVWGYVENEHERMLQEWDTKNNPYGDVDEEQVGVVIRQRDGTAFRPVTPAEAKEFAKAGKWGPKVRSHEGRHYLPTRIPPRPTFEDAKQSILKRYPGASEFIGGGAESTTGPGVTRLKFPPAPDHITALRDQMAAQAGGGQPGQVMPQVPQVRRPDLIPARGPSAGGMAEYGAAGFEERGRVRPGEALQQTDIDIARSTADQAYKEKSEIRGRAIGGLRKRHGNEAQVALTNLIGTENSPQTALTQKFEQHVRSGRDPSEFGRYFFAKEEISELRKAIPALNKDWGGKTPIDPTVGEGLLATAQIALGIDPRGPAGTKPEWRKKAERRLKGRDLNSYFAIERAYERKREVVIQLATEAVRHTPRGQKVDVANIPTYTHNQFDQAVQKGEMKVGTMIMTSAGVKPVTSQDIRAAQDRLWQRRGVPLQQMR